MSDAGNAADYFVTRHLREGRGDRIAFADPWRTLTYAELDAAAARFAAAPDEAIPEAERKRVWEHLRQAWQRRCRRAAPARG